MEFSGAAEGLRYNDEALKDLFNSALDEPLSWWRMSGLDHLTFGEFVESLMMMMMMMMMHFIYGAFQNTQGHLTSK